MRNHIVVRLVAYYTAVLLAVVGLFRAFPMLGDYIARERARQGGRAELELSGVAGSIPSTPGAEGLARLLDPATSVPILSSLVLALLVALPVVWVYRWTRPRARYSQGFAHTMLVVPIAITLVVFLVKGSLALAFGLAGIVAAVRFRTSLDEPMDAVYMFIVIGTGLAAGVQLLSVAFIASILFNAVALTIWRMNFGDRPAVLQGWRIVEAAPAGQAPGQGLGAGGTVRAYVPVDEEEAAPRFNAWLRVYAAEPQGAQGYVEAYLGSHVKKWRLVEITPQADGSSIIEFELRIKKSTDASALIRDIEQGDPGVSRAELTKSAR